MDLATLGIAVDSRPVASATDDLNRFTPAARRAEQAADSFGNNASKAAQRTEREYQRTIATIDRMRAAFGLLAGVLATGAVARMADQWSELNSRVRNAVGDMGNAEQVMGRLAAMARRTYSDLNQTAEGWLSTAGSLSALGISIDKQLDIVESLNNAMVVSATRGQRAESVMRAWSNAMALGSLRGDDLNSVLTNSDRLARALADSIGINVNELRAYGAAGRITRDELVGVTSQLEKLREEADAMPATLADGLTLMRNALLETVGVLDQAGGLSERLAGRMVALADNMGTALTVAGAGALVLAARLGGPLAAGYASATAAAVANQTAVLSGNATMLGSTQAAASKATNMAQVAAAEQAAAKATLAAAQADLVRARNLLAAARAGQVAGVTQAQALANFAAASRTVSAAQTGLVASTMGATAAVSAQTGAMAANTVAARAMAGATAAASSALALVGGPAGAAIIALGGAMYLAASRAQDAQARSDRYADAIQAAGDRSNGASGGIREAARALAEVETAATGAERAVSLAMAQTDLARLTEQMQRQLGWLEFRLMFTMDGASRAEMMTGLKGVVDEFLAGDRAAEDFIATLDRIARTNPDASAVIAEIQKIVQQMAAAQGAIEGFSAALSQMADRGGRVLKRPALGDMEFDQRWNAGWGDIADQLRQQREQLTRSGVEVDRYGDALRNMREGWDSNLGAMRLQVRMFGETEGAIAAARFEMEELAKARRLAADKDATFDENGADARRIREVAAELGLLTDRVHALREAEQERERALRETEQRRQQINDALAGLELEVSLIGLPEVEQQVARQLHQLKLSHADLDGQRIAGQIRYNASLEETQEQLEKQRQLVENVASTFLDLFTDNSSDSFFDRIMKGLSDIGRQFAELGKQRLMERLFGGDYTIGQPAPGQRTIAQIGVARAANQNVPLATQAVTEQLSANVTKTVSDNLLRNMLGAGKDPSHIRGLNAEFASSLTQMFEAAPEAVRASVTINSGFRSVARQAELFEAALAKYGSEAAARKWVAPPGRSQHNRGMAVDLGYGNSASREWVHQNAARFGLQFPMSHENWHIEPMNARGGGSAAALRNAVRDGSLDATRALASGQAGVPTSSVPIPTARPGGQSGGGLLGGLGGAMQSPMFGQGLSAISAFGAGFQSGSPVSGGFSGAMSAFGMGLGLPGILLGGAAGLIGGLFGRSRRKREERRQREAQERQQMLQAQQQLEAAQPQILDLEDMVLDRASGTLERERSRIQAQLKQYAQLAATAKDTAEQQRLASLQDNLSDHMERMFDRLRLTASSVVASLESGRGLDSEFAKAASGISELTLSLRNYLTDLEAAAGQNSDTVQRATAGARTQLLRQLSGADELTEIYARLDALSGTAAQLGTELQKLGMSAEDAGRAISDHLGRGIQRLRDEFVRGIADETAEGMGLGYLPQIRALLERRETMRADATSLGADPALIDRWFGVQARNILDQAGLLDKEIAPLVAAFPDLANVLGDASAKIERSLADAENDLRTAYQRVRQFADQLASFRDDIKLDRNLSTLGPEERLLEAQKQFRAVAEKAAAGDAEAQGQLIGLSRSYLDEAKAFYTTSEAYYAIFREVDGTLKSTEAKAVAELDLAKSQYGALLSLNESVLTIPQALAAMDAAQAARDLAQGQALQAYVQALNPQVAIPSYQAPGPVTGNPAPAPAPAPAGPALVNQTMWNGSSYSNYVGSWTTLTDRGLISFIGSDRLFVPTGMDQASALILANTNQAGPSKGGPVFNWDAKRLGGEIGRGYGGLGYQAGGVVANGTWDVDSVFARHRDGGAVMLAGGEFVTTARGVTAETRPVLDFINREHRLPELRMPRIAMPSAPSIRGQDNRELVAAVGRLEAGLDRVRQAVGLGAVGTIDAVDRGTRVNQEQAAEARRRRAAP